MGPVTPFFVPPFAKMNYENKARALEKHEETYRSEIPLVWVRFRTLGSRNISTPETSYLPEAGHATKSSLSQD